MHLQNYCNQITAKPNNNQIYTTWYKFGTGGRGGWIGIGGGPKSVTSDPQVQQTSDGNDQVFGTGGGQVEQNWYNPNGTYGGVDIVLIRKRSWISEATNESYSSASTDLTGSSGNIHVFLSAKVGDIYH